MSKYDSGFFYDKKQNDGGFAYDYKSYSTVLNLFDSVYVSENITNLSCLIMKREQMSMTDLNNMLCMKDLKDTLKLDEETFSILVFIEKMETIQTYDVFTNILAKVYQYENGLTLLEELNTIALNSIAENINLSETSYVKAFLEMSQELELDEAKQLFAYLYQLETVGVTDFDIDTAISDFYIGKDESLDNRFDNWLVPFDLLLAPRQSRITIMPPTESTQISIPYADGSITQDTIYTNRNWNLVGYSMQNLSVAEKEALKEKITELLDTTKNETQTLTFSKNNMSFDVKYQGELDIEEAPTWIKATIPLEVSPYGKELFVQQIWGDGIMINNGHADIGAKVMISGVCVNPHFYLGSTEFLWTGTVPSGKTLVIDNESRTCYLVDELGEKEEAFQNLAKGDTFSILPKGTQMVVRSETESTKENIYIEYQPRYLWKDAVEEEE